MGSVFISYRREDTQMAAGRLADFLKARFPNVPVVIDVETDQVGLDYREVIGRHLGASSVVVAMIGDEFLKPGPDGKRRIDAPNDPVRFELSRALERGLPVIPVLVDDARLPNADELPESISGLSFRGAAELAHQRFDRDASFIADQIGRLLESSTPPERQQPTSGSAAPVPTPPPPARPKPLRRLLLYAALAVVGLVVLVGAILAMSTGSDGDDDADAVVTSVTTDDTPTSSEDTSTSGEPSSPPETTQPPDTLAALQELEFGQTLATADEQHVLEVDANGQLVLWSEGTERWRAPDDSQPGAVAVMQEDGNFVLYRSRAEIGLPNSALYASGTNGHEGDGAALSVVEDGGLGFVVIRTSSGAELWRRPTETPQPPDTAPPTSSAPSSSSPPSSTSPTPASLTLESASVTGDGDNPTAHFVVSNSGGQPGEIDGVRLNVTRGFWTRVRTPGPSPSRFDVDVLALSPTEPNDIDIAWEPIEPSSTSGPQERTLTFGRSSGGSEPEFAWTVDCTATLLVDGQPVAGTDVALTVVVNPPAP